MKKFFYLLLPLMMACMMSSCLTDDEEEGTKDDSEIAESLVGLWYGKMQDFVVRLVDLRADRTAVYSNYPAYSHTVLTEYYPKWTAGSKYLVLGDMFLPCAMNHLEMQDPVSLKYRTMRRIYSPKTDRSLNDMATLTNTVWTGYYGDKIITLVFSDDGTMTRTDKPNAGWEGETIEAVYNWSVSDNVIHLSGPGDAWGVTVENDFTIGDVIFVDFGDVASVFCE